MLTRLPNYPLIQQLAITLPACSYQDVKETHGLWENKWLKLSAKLHKIKRTPYPWLFSENITRKQETAVTRLRIVHYTHITHQLLMNREESPNLYHLRHPMAYILTVIYELQMNTSWFPIIELVIGLYIDNILIDSDELSYNDNKTMLN